MAAAVGNTPPPLERIDSNPLFAAAAGILRTLEDGLQQIEREADALRIEEHLAHKPSDPRAGVLQERLKKHRGAAPQKVAEPTAEADLPPTVAAALEVICGGSRPARRLGRKALIEQAEDDAARVREAILAQQTVVDGIRNELSGELASRGTPQHRELVLAIYRAAQALAAATDAEREFRRTVVDAGYVWRTDLLPALTMRSALILGSEADWDSEISRARRLLEEVMVLT
jgi:hypothetical protein